MRRQMHMLQHRAHADAQVERIRLDTLLREHGVLVRVLGKAQTRTTRLLTEKSSELEKLTTQVMQARAESIGKDSVTAFFTGRSGSAAHPRPRPGIAQPSA